MSIVGPRPALPTQVDLINKRKIHGIDKINLYNDMRKLMGEI